MDFYHRSASILDAIDAKKGSVKGLSIKAAKKPGEGGRFLRIVIQVLEYRPVIQHLIEQSQLLTKEKSLFVAPSHSQTVSFDKNKPVTASKALKSIGKKHPNHKGNASEPPSPANLAQVLVHDLIFAKRGIVLAKEHKIRKQLETYKDQLNKELARERKRRMVPDNEALKVTLPDQVASSVQAVGKGKKRQREDEEAAAGVVRWLRVNTLKWSTEDAVEWFENERWELVDDVSTLVERAQEKSKVFTLDEHIEPLLALPISTVLTSLPPYRDGQLIAQDKASCMSAWVLLSSYYADWYDIKADDGDYARVEAQRKKMAIRVMDATAAPGNKTTMAAALAGTHSKVFAVERDAGRHKVLKEMCAKAGATNVQTLHTDFLSLKPDDQKFKNVSHILVDPSCSGSGIPNRLDHLVHPTSASTDEAAPSAEAEKRIKSLSNFQVAILSHALRFQGARRVVYSTCSVHPEEDEHVVKRVLSKKDLLALGWRLAPRDDVLPDWDRRGRVEECDGDQDMAESLVRCLPEDGTNGFFVACFVKEDAEPSSRTNGHQPSSQYETADEDVVLSEHGADDALSEGDEEWAGIAEEDQDADEPHGGADASILPAAKKAKLGPSAAQSAQPDGVQKSKLSKNAKKKLLRQQQQE